MMMIEVLVSSMDSLRSILLCPCCFCCHPPPLPTLSTIPSPFSQMTRFKWALTKHICRTDKLSGLIRDKTKKVRLGKKKQCTLLVDFPGYEWANGKAGLRFTSSWRCLPVTLPFRVVAVFEQPVLHPMEGGTTYLPLGCDNDQVMLRNCYRKAFLYASGRPRHLRSRTCCIGYKQAKRRLLLTFALLLLSLLE